MKFDIYSGFFVTGYKWIRHEKSQVSYGMFEELVVGDSYQCLMTCRMNAICDSVNFRPTDNTCQLIAQYKPSAVNRTDIIVSNDWEWWSDEATDLIN